MISSLWHSFFFLSILIRRCYELLLFWKCEKFLLFVFFSFRQMYCQQAMSQFDLMKLFTWTPYASRLFHNIFSNFFHVSHRLLLSLYIKPYCNWTALWTSSQSWIRPCENDFVFFFFFVWQIDNLLSTIQIKIMLIHSRWCLFIQCSQLMWQMVFYWSIWEDVMLT